MKLQAGVEALLLTALAWGVSGQETALHRVKRQFGISFGFPNFNQFGQQSSTGAPGRQEQQVDLGQIFGSVVGGFLNPQSQNQNNNILGAVAGFNQATNPGSAGNCGNANGGCQQGCQQQGQFTRCFCNAGYVLNRDRKTCSDINECIFNNAGCSQICNNAPGSFTCACGNGFTLLGDKRSCGPGQTSPVVGQQPGAFGSCAVNNGGCEQFCRPRRNGSYICRCQQGFTLNQDQFSCTPITASPDTSPDQGCFVQNGGCQQLCQQTFAGVRCGCNPGFTLQNDGRTCVAVPTGPNCAVSNGGCQQLCSASGAFGASPCGCNPGFVINSDGISCTDVNECQVNNGGCQQLCVNTPGTFQCQCQPGFNLVGGNACQAAVTPGPVTAPLTGCGVNNNKRINMNTRIVGGKPSNPKDWPWMVALLQTRNTAQFCGGALITSRHVLTAAHCVNQFTVADITVRVGEYDFTITTDNSPTDFKLAEIRAHEQYDTATQENDIAVLRMERDVTFNEFVQPACLPPADNQDLAGLNAVVTGWGTTSFGGSVSNVLREVQIPIWTRAECDTAYPGKVFPLMMCAGIRAGGKDSCQGDSGGPLVTQFPASNTWYLVGVVSWGIECARADRPGVYTRVNQYLPWIAQKTSS